MKIVINLMRQAETDRHWGDSIVTGTLKPFSHNADCVC